MDKVVVDVKLTEKDVVEFQKAHYAKIVKPGMRITILIIIAVLFVVNVVIDIAGGQFISLTAILLGIILIVLLSTPLMFRLSARKSLRTNKMLAATQTFTFTKKSFSSISEYNKVHSKWDVMHEFSESQDNFLVYVGSNQAFLIPKRCLDNASDKMDFIRECASEIPAKKKPFNLFKWAMGISIGLAVVLFIILILVEGI